MTRFLDVRLWPVGGELAQQVSLFEGTDSNNYAGLPLQQLQRDIAGRHVLLGTHGFNVNRKDGIASLSNWESLLQLPSPSVFAGILWPGDSIWLHGLDYPEEPRVADDAGGLIAPFIDTNFSGAASISFASHSLGARLVLQTVLKMVHPIRRVILMAGAIDDDCLAHEFQKASANIAQISVLASHEDQVLSKLFPLGNFVGGILDKGHPWWHAALGHTGPSSPTPPNFLAPFQIPDGLDFGHHNYLQIDVPQIAVVPLPENVPADPIDIPGGGKQGWQEAFSAAFCSTRFE